MCRRSWMRTSLSQDAWALHSFVGSRALRERQLVRPLCSLYVLILRRRINSFQPSPSWSIRSSSRKNLAKPKTSAPPSVLVTEKSFQPRVIYSTCSSRKMSCRSGSAGRRSAEGGNKAAKLRAIREALRSAKRVWLATDCDREGQLIGQEILEHYEYRGQVMRVLFTAQELADHLRRIRSGKTKCRICAALRRRRCAPPGRPNLQSVTNPYCDRHPSERVLAA